MALRFVVMFLWWAAAVVHACLPAFGVTRYDAAGNLILDGGYLYQYDGFNRLVQVSQRGTLDVDAEGEWTGSPGPWVAHYTYDALGRLIRRQAPWPQPSLSESRIRTERYFYDGVRRIQEVFTDPLGVAAPGEPLAIGAEAEVVQPGTESAAGGAGGAGSGGAAMLLPTTVTWTEREYIYGPDGVDEMVCQVSPSTAQAAYTLLDASGSVVALVDRDGDVLEQYSYDPYGNVLTVDTLAPCPRNRVGHQGLFFDRFDAGTTGPVLAAGAPLAGHNRNRTYIPELGRFLQKDPNGTALAVVAAAAMHGRALGGSLDGFDAQALYGNGMSLYAYLGANPVNRSDPLGLSWDPFDMVDDYLAESSGNRAAFMERLNTGFDATLYVGLQIAQLHPAVGMAVAAYKVANGTADVWDLMDLVPGAAAAGILAKAAGKLHKARQTYDKGRTVSLRVLNNMCFVAGTLVWSADGPIAIESLQEQVIEQHAAGAQVLVRAKDERTGEVALRPVVAVSVRHDVPIVEVRITVEDGSVETIGTTEEHPFWVVGRGWVEAGHLAAGDQLLSLEGGSAIVSNVHSTDRVETVYNLTVGEFHTYFVGESAVWVHNECPIPAFTAAMNSRAQVIAAGGRIQKIGLLISNFGGTRRGWKKMKTWTDDGQEIHYYFHHGIGRRGEKWAGSADPF